LSRPIIFRSRRESLQENRIILAGSLQQTFATKSAHSGRAIAADECLLSGVKRTSR
jgi:hypothetical protein